MTVWIQEVRKTWAASFTGIRGAMEKGFEKARLARVEIPTRLDLSHVPNYVSYKAALIREKMLLQYGCLALLAVLLMVFATSRFEVAGLEEKLRKKEFILAPGVNDFIPASPQSVPDSYVQHAVSDFVATLGNTNPTNIDERYHDLSTSMSPSLQIPFQIEAESWATKAKRDNISEMITVLDKTIESDDAGNYRAIVRARADSFVANESIGFRNEVIELGLKLVPPEHGRRWYLEITSLSRVNAEAYDSAKTLGGSHEK